MVLRPRLRQIFKTLLLYVGAGGAIAYFAVQGYGGEYGLNAKREYEATIATLEGDRAALRGQREALERRVQLMRPESLDPDMLDEQVREVLDRARPEDLILLRPKR